MTTYVEAIGRVAQFGELYDARTDKFQNLFLFDIIPDEAIIKTENKNTKLKFETNNSLKNKFDCLNVSAQIKLPILSGLIELEGSGKYFKDIKKSAKVSKVSLIQEITTLKEQINVNNKGIKCLQDLDILEHIDATHVVVGIQWGGYVFISIEDNVSSNNNIQKIESKGSFSSKLAKLPLYVSGELTMNEEEKDEINSFNFELYGDIIPEEVPMTLIEALNFLKNSPTFLKESNVGKGKGVKYFLIPLSTIRKLWKKETNFKSNINSIDESIIMRTIDLFDSLNLIDQNLNDLYNDVNDNRFSFKREEINEISDLKRQFNIFQIEAQRDLSEKLISVRSGISDLNKLEDLIEKLMGHSLFNINFESSKYNFLRQKISFLNYMKKLNIIFINRNLTIDEFLRDQFNNNCYILFYNFKSISWSDKTITYFSRLILENKEENSVFAASEHLLNEAKNNEISTSLNVPNKISLYNQCNVVIENLNETNHSINEKIKIIRQSINEFIIDLLSNIKCCVLKRELDFYKRRIDRYESQFLKNFFNLVPIDLPEYKLKITQKEKDINTCEEMIRSLRNELKIIFKFSEEFSNFSNKFDESSFKDVLEGCFTSLKENISSYQGQEIIQAECDNCLIHQLINEKLKLLRLNIYENIQEIKKNIEK